MLSPIFIYSFIQYNFAESEVDHFDLPRVVGLCGGVWRCGVWSVECGAGSFTIDLAWSMDANRRTWRQAPEPVIATTSLGLFLNKKFSNWVVWVCAQSLVGGWDGGSSY